MADLSWAREKRKSFRIDAQCPCTIARFDADGNPRGQRPSKTFNLSAGGIGLETDFSIRSGEILKIAVALGDQWVTFRGKVAYTSHQEGGRFQSGISIGEIGKMERITLTRFIYYFKPSQGPPQEA